MGNIISDSDIENFYKDIENKKLYDFYCDYGYYLFNKPVKSYPKIIEIFTDAAKAGNLFCCDSAYQNLINYYDFDEIMGDYDKASTILDYLLDEIVFANLCKFKFILLMGYLIKYSKFSEKISSKYLVFIKEINDYINSVLNMEEKEKEKERIMNEEYGVFFYFNKAYIYYFGFKGIEECNLQKAIEFLDKANNISKDIYNKKHIEFLKYNIKILMNNLNLIDKEELIKAKKDIMKYFWNNSNLNYEIIDCYIIAEDYFEGITQKQDKFISMMIYKSTQNIFCKSINDCKVKSEIKKIIKKEENKIENKLKDEICGICYEKKANKIFIPCKHNFCSFCVDKLGEGPKCPYCRTEILKII